MKMKIVTIAIGLSLAISAAQGAPILNIIENNENLNVSFNGGKPSFVKITPISIPGIEHGWNIELTQGWTLASDFILDAELREPEGGRVGGPFGMPLENFIHFFGEGFNTIQFLSEHETFGDVSSLAFSEVRSGALIAPDGTAFDIRVGDVPESSSTVSIFGIGLAGLAWFARFRRRAM